jgi:hypothetical protein
MLTKKNLMQNDFLAQNIIFLEHRIKTLEERLAQLEKNTIKFYTCYRYHDQRSHKSWWSGYNVLSGHTHMGKYESLLVSQTDYDNLLTFAGLNHINEEDKTYQMDITHHYFFGDYWTLSNFSVYEGQYCQEQR